MTEPTVSELLHENLGKYERRADQTLADHDKRLDVLEDEVKVVPVMKRAFYWVMVVLTGAMISLIGAAVTVILTSGGGK
jgi:hypothetical protein